MTMSDPFPTETLSAMTEERRRELAIRRIKAKHDFRIHLLAYAVVNAALVVAWFLTSEQADGGEPYSVPSLYAACAAFRHPVRRQSPERCCRTVVSPMPSS